MMPTPLNFRSNLEDALVDKVVDQKRFSKMSRVVGGNPESRPSIILELGIVEGRLGTMDAPELLAVSGS